MQKVNIDELLEKKKEKKEEDVPEWMLKRRKRVESIASNEGIDAVSEKSGSDDSMPEWVRKRREDFKGPDDGKPAVTAKKPPPAAPKPKNVDSGDNIRAKSPLMGRKGELTPQLAPKPAPPKPGPKPMPRSPSTGSEEFSKPPPVAPKKPSASPVLERKPAPPEKPVKGDSSPVLMGKPAPPVKKQPPPPPVRTTNITPITPPQERPTTTASPTSSEPVYYRRIPLPTFDMSNQPRVPGRDSKPPPPQGMANGGPPTFKPPALEVEEDVGEDFYDDVSVAQQQQQWGSHSYIPEERYVVQ